MRARPAIDRFNEKYVINEENGCWEWIAALDSKGYGYFSYQGTRANRVSYELFIGPIPEGMLVLHKCDNRRCVNPEHLFLGTQLENIKDRQHKNRQSKGEIHGSHKLTDQEVLEIRAKYAAGGITQKELSIEYGITEAPICFIINRKTWTHI